MEIVLGVLNYWWIAALVIMAVFYKSVLRILGIVMIAENEIGIVTKKWKLIGKNRNLPDGDIIALNGEAGVQADTLAPGIHFWLWPWQFIVQHDEFVTIDEGNIGVVEARDGKALSNGRILAPKVECNSFQDARAFLTNNGGRGPQIAIIPPGTYRINKGDMSIKTYLPNF